MGLCMGNSGPSGVLHVPQVNAIHMKAFLAQRSSGNRPADIQVVVLGIEMQLFASHPLLTRENNWQNQAPEQTQIRSKRRLWHRSVVLSTQSATLKSLNAIDISAG